MMKPNRLSAMLYPEHLIRLKESAMFDYNSHISGEIRRLTFQKSTNHGMWQDSIWQPQTNKPEIRPGKNVKGGWLSNLSNAVLLHIGLWKQHILSSHEDRLQADQSLTVLGTKTSENRQSG
jgi:hypothetical protein